MQKPVLYFLLALLFMSCKGDQPLNLEADKVLSSKGIDIPVYDFDSLEPLLRIDDGKTRIVNFWATWCKPCVSELPYFEMINSKYSDSEVEVILVSLDLANQVETKLIPFVRRQRIESKIVLLDDTDADTWIRKVNKDWSGAIPATIIYKGAVSNFYERSFTYNELEKELKKIL